MIWVLLAIIIVTYIINKIALNYGFDDLSYSMEINKRAAEIGEKIEITSIIENNKFMTVSFLKIDERFPKGLNIRENTYTLFIMPFQRVKRTYNVFGKKRGLYNLDNIVLTMGDFIGIDTIRRQVIMNEQIIILPEKVDLYENIIPIGSLMGDTSVKRWIIDDPLMTIGIREYTGNEPERFIHWPSSLRHGNLMVKNFDFTTDNSVMIVLNLETMKPSWKPVEEELIEKVISLTRAVMEEFEALRIPYGFASNANHFNHPGLGSSHLNDFLEQLGKIDYKLPRFFENTLIDIGKMKGNYSTIVIITPRILDTYVEVINGLSRTVNGTVVISLEEEYMDELNENIIKYRRR